MRGVVSSGLRRSVGAVSRVSQFSGVIPHQFARQWIVGMGVVAPFLLVVCEILINQAYSAQGFPSNFLA